MQMTYLDLPVETNLIMFSYLSIKVVCLCNNKYSL